MSLEKEQGRLPIARLEGGSTLSIIITDDDVRRLLSMEECIEAMRVAFEDFSNGSAVNRPRVRYLARKF